MNDDPSYDSMGCFPSAESPKVTFVPFEPCEPPTYKISWGISPPLWIGPHHEIMIRSKQKRRSIYRPARPQIYLRAGRPTNP